MASVPLTWKIGFAARDCVATNHTAVDLRAAVECAPQIVDHALGRVRNGSIVVMHLNGAPNAPRTYRALRTIIPELRARGYELVTLSELLAGSAPPE